MEIYITIYRHIGGTQYVQLNKTQEGQQKFIEKLNKKLFNIESIACQEVDE